MSRFSKKFLPPKDDNINRCRQLAKPSGSFDETEAGISKWTLERILQGITRNSFFDNNKSKIPKTMAIAALVTLAATVAIAGCVSDNIGHGDYYGGGYSCSYFFNKNGISDMNCICYSGYCSYVDPKGFETCFKNMSSHPPQRIKYGNTQCFFDKDGIRCNQTISVASYSPLEIDELFFETGCKSGYAEAKKHYGF